MKIAIAVAIAMGAIVLTIITTESPAPYLTVATSGVGKIIGDSWHYVGKETLYGGVTYDLCPILGNITGEPLACHNQPSYLAPKYVNDKGDSAYLLETGVGPYSSGGNKKVGTTEIYVVVVNSRVYCVTTNTTIPIPSQYTRCPSIS
jgi:hypothetical protein